MQNLVPERFDKEEFDRYQKDFRLDASDLESRILDVGCNRGEFISHVRRSVGNTNAFGLDVRHRGASDAYVRGNGTCLPFAANTFDIVLARNYIPMFFSSLRGVDVVGAVSELLRVVRPGGRLMFNAGTPWQETIPSLILKEGQAYVPTKQDHAYLRGSVLLEQYLEQLELKGYLVSRRHRRMKRTVFVLYKPL